MTDELSVEKIAVCQGDGANFGEGETGRKGWLFVCLILVYGVVKEPSETGIAHGDYGVRRYVGKHVERLARFRLQIESKTAAQIEDGDLPRFQARFAAQRLNTGGHRGCGSGGYRGGRTGSARPCTHARTAAGA